MSRTNVMKFEVAGTSLVAIAAGLVWISSITFSPARADTEVAAADRTGAQQCFSLNGQKLGGAIVDKADYIPKGGATISPLVKATNAICRVSAHANPVAGSEIKIRVWLPSNWNGKLLGVGGAGLNGGFAAEWFTAVHPMNRGYAIFATDAGHDPKDDDARWAFKQPEKIKDYGYRANHVGAIASKAVISAYYGQSAKRSYFHGCSNGGRDALIQAQRYPQDWDGIISGAPANDWTGIFTTFAHIAQISEPHRLTGVLGPKMKLLYDVALKQCDAADGLKDGLISNPTKCHVNPAVLQCKGGTGPDCLSKSEVSTLRELYSGVRTSDGKLVMPGFSAGSELSWSGWFTRPEKEVGGGMQEIFRYMVHEDPNWSWKSFNIDRDYQAIKKLAPIMDATDTDLRPFTRRGGKLLMYHGWEDTLIPAENSIRYFEAVRTKLRTQARHTRLFMVPGMAHCFGGSGPNVIDLVGALDSWVETGRAPERLTSLKYESFLAALIAQPTKLLQSRPVCAWPKTPQYKGSGAVDQESSFVCR